MPCLAVAITICSSYPGSFRFKVTGYRSCVYLIPPNDFLPTGKIVATRGHRGINSACTKPSRCLSLIETDRSPLPQSLFSRKLGFALLPKGLDPLLGIRRSRDSSQGLRLIFQLALQRAIGRLQEQVLDSAIRFGGTRRQLSRDFLRLWKNHIIVDHIVDQSS